MSIGCGEPEDDLQAEPTESSSTMEASTTGMPASVTGALDGASTGSGGTTSGTTGDAQTGDEDDTGTSGGEVIDELDVLFIGNSHTYLDDIPETDLPLVVADLAQSQGKTLVVDSVAEPFRSLEEHWFDGEALTLIELGGWDVVVLQERYQPSVDDPMLTLEYAQLFQAEIEAVGADTMLYVLWARDYELEVQPDIVANSTMVADALGAELSPVGPAWESIRMDYPTMVLAQEDPQSHANRRGAYLSAAVFYGALFLEDPLGLPAETILEEDPTEPEAALLQEAAAEALTALAAGEGPFR